MTMTTISEFASNLRMLRGDQASLPVVYIGEQAARGPHNSSWLDELRSRVLHGGEGLPPTEAEMRSPADRQELFVQRWARMMEGVRRKVLGEVIGHLDLSEGYRSLAALLREGYFSLVLTGNPDPLIEQSIEQQRTGPLEYRMIYPIDQPTLIESNLRPGSRKFVVLKLISDFSHDEKQAVGHITEELVRERMSQLRPLIQPYLQGPLLFVGYGYYDREIIRHFPNSPDCDGVYFAGEAIPEAFLDHFGHRGPLKVNLIQTSAPDFDSFFVELARELLSSNPGHSAPTGPIHPSPMDAVPPTSPVYPPRYPDRPPMHPEPEPHRMDRLIPTPPPDGPIIFELDPVTVFDAHVDLNTTITFNVSGARTYTAEEGRAWSDLDIDRENAEMITLGEALRRSYAQNSREAHDAWRQQAKAKGKRLFHRLNVAHPDLGNNLFAAMRDLDESHLTIRFGGPITHLGIPYELLYQGDNPIAIRYPLCRRISGIPIRSRDFAEFAQSRSAHKESLDVLLIAANVDGSLPMADREVEEIAESLSRNTSHPAEKPKVHVKIVRSNQATADQVRGELKNCRYHIVHFAGHSRFDPHDPDNGGLVLKKRWGGGSDLLRVNELITLLRPSQHTQLFFLSSCTSAAAAGREHLLRHDSLGLLDALVRAEIPYVLGYRWYVTDQGGLEFARAFYDALFSGLSIPEKSVLAARQHIYGLRAMDETWVSPILVAQHVYAG